MIAMHRMQYPIQRHAEIDISTQNKRQEIESDPYSVLNLSTTLITLTPNVISQAIKPTMRTPLNARCFEQMVGLFGQMAWIRWSTLPTSWKTSS